MEVTPKELLKLSFALLACMVRLLDSIGTVEIFVLVAIGIEMFALYKHTKLENRMDEHIQNTCDHLLRSDKVMKALDEHINKFDEHLIRYDEHINRLDDLILKFYVQSTGKKFEEPTA